MFAGGGKNYSYATVVRYLVNRAAGWLVACNRYVVGRVTAVDADPGDNGVVRYSVDDSDEAAAGFLTVDAEDGTLTLARPLDRESRRRVDVPLRARDLGVGGQWLEARRVFTVLVADVNDHPPRFTRAAYSVSVHQVVSYYLFYTHTHTPV